MRPALRRTMRHTICPTRPVAKFAFTQIRCNADGILATFLANRTTWISSIARVTGATIRSGAVTILGTGSMANGLAIVC